MRPVDSCGIKDRDHVAREIARRPRLRERVVAVPGAPVVEHDHRSVGEVSDRGIPPVMVERQPLHEHHGTPRIIGSGSHVEPESCSVICKRVRHDAIIAEGTDSAWRTPAAAQRLRNRRRMPTPVIAAPPSMTAAAAITSLFEPPAPPSVTTTGPVVVADAEPLPVADVGLVDGAGELVEQFSAGAVAEPPAVIATYGTWVYASAA